MKLFLKFIIIILVIFCVILDHDVYAGEKSVEIILMGIFLLMTLQPIGEK